MTRAARRTPGRAAALNQSAASTTSPSTLTHSASASAGTASCGSPGPSLTPTGTPVAAMSVTTLRGGENASGSNTRADPPPPT